MHVLQGLFSEHLPNHSCQAGFGRFLPHIQPMESKHVMVSCHNPAATNIVTCQDSRLNLFLDEIDGFAFDVAPSSTPCVKEPYIPIFDYRTIALAFECTAKVVGLTLIDILSNPLKRSGGHYVAKKIAFRDAAIIQHLCASKKVILFLTGLDVLIETVWHQRSTCELFQQLRWMGFWSVTGFNFSVFGGECPVAQLLNQKKSLISSLLLEKYQISTIPHIYAVNNFHIKRYQQWLKQNPQIQLITINCQMQHSVADIEQVVRTAQAMLNSNGKLHIILQGYWLSEIYRFKGFLHRIHIADSKPVKYGQNFRHVDPAIITKPGQYQKSSYRTMVIENVEYRIRKMENLLTAGIIDTKKIGHPHP